MRTHRKRLARALLCLFASATMVFGTATFVAPSPLQAVAAYRILITGDSKTQGSSGDYTWRYRLWNKLQSTESAPVDFVGTRTDLFDNVNDRFGSQYYADEFAGKAHAAQWGDTFVNELDNIEGQVSATNANVLVTMLGHNDLAFWGSAADAVSRLRTYIDRARTASPGIDIVIGEVVNAWDPWASQYVMTSAVDEYANRIEDLASELNSSSERIVVAKTRTGWDAKDHTWDGTHPNPTGEALIAQRVSQALATLGIGSSLPSISGEKAWNVTAPAVRVAPGSEEAQMSWSRTSTGAMGMFIEQRLTNIDEAWVRLPWAVSGDGWVAGYLASGGTYDFRIVPSKGWNTGLSGPATRVTIGGPSLGAIASATVTQGGDSAQWGGKEATLKWSASENSTGYYLASRLMSNNATLPWDFLPYPVENREWVFAMLAQGRRYQFAVRGNRGYNYTSWKQSAFSRTRGLPAGRAYAALGDSYASGLGAASSSGYTGGDCYRTSNAWAYKMQSGWQASTKHLACASKTIDHVRSTQIPAMETYFDANRGKPQLITMTIGGNDVGFSSVIKQCLGIQPGGCAGSEASYHSNIDKLQPRLRQIYDELQASQPYADILVGGYPWVVGDGKRFTTVCNQLGNDESAMIKRLSDHLNSVISAAASQAGVMSVGFAVRDRFKGHNACENPNSGVWINDVDFDLGGPIAGLVGANSFHPTQAGQLAYALAFSDSLIALTD